MFSLAAMVFVRHFENEMLLTINHGREMPTICNTVGNYNKYVLTILF